MKNVIIFGSSGFIGNNIVKHLETKECNAMGFSSKTCNLLHRSDIQKAFSLISGDLSLVICSSITPPEANSIESMLSNIKMIDNIVKEISTNRLEKIIFLSSINIYGRVKVEKKINESFSLKPTGYYGLSKLVCEHILNLATLEIPVTILRLPGIYGYGDNFKSIVGRFIKNAILKREINIINDGNELRDYVEINNLTEIVWHFILNSHNGPVNIATGQSKTINEIAKKIIQKLNNNSNITMKKAPIISSDLVFDNNLIKSLLPSFDFINVFDGIDNYIEKLTKADNKLIDTNQ